MIKNFIKIVLIAAGSTQMIHATKSDHCCSLDLEHGANHLQTAPIVQSASFDTNKVIVKGLLKSVPKTKFVIQFFNNMHPDQGPDATNGNKLVGQITVKTDMCGHASFKATVLCSNAGTFISATATRLCGNRPTDTSEFSSSVEIQ